MLQEGLLSEEDYQKVKELKRSAKYKSKGYAFLTFTHADQAMKALYLYQGTMLEGKEMQIMIKGDKKHEDFDALYMHARIKRDSRLTEEVERAKEARKELRDFEKNIDKDLPSLKKLRKFQEVAKDIIEDTPNKFRVGKRTPEEEEALRRKILAKERKDGVDHTALFDTERAEAARKNLHKKAFASYKAYEFLKHGIKSPKKAYKNVSKAKKKGEYAFPPLEETVASLLHDGGAFSKVRDVGERLDKPGRRTEYS